MPPAGIAIFAHGSAIESANDAVRIAAAEFARSTGFSLVEPCFLGPGRPDLPEAVSRLVQRGAGRILIVPYFLTFGKHIEQDLPNIVAGMAAAHPGIEISVTPPFDGHPALLAILEDRVRQALSSSTLKSNQ